jgi:acetyl esterase/lipase|uniref:Alpha/beta hydrolase fold-3 domain-containing protein n=1 Tax=Fagus sylvatica TaxID=28930 RepID=A0A2N9HAU0_FAGSY
MASITKEIEKEFLPFIRMYKDGSIERLMGTPYVPPSPQDQETGVSSKDITISPDPSISARLYLPKLNQTHHQKLPILVYFHGGGFCIESAFSFDHQRFLNSLVSQAQVIAVSVEYRMAPEHFLPIAYEDCWASLQWVASHIDNKCVNKEPWLIDHGDFNRVFLGGDSAGANIVHNIAMRAGVESLHGGVKVLGAFLTHPYFWGSKPIRSESREVHEKLLPYLVWNFVYPTAPGGLDNPMIDPIYAAGAPSLSGLGCSRVLVTVSEKDELLDRGVSYYEELIKSKWEGEAELVQVEGEDHAFHVLHFDTQNAKNLIKRLASFLLK